MTLPLERLKQKLPEKNLPSMSGLLQQVRRLVEPVDIHKNLERRVATHDDDLRIFDEPPMVEEFSNDESIINIDAHNDIWVNVLTQLRSCVPKIADAMSRTDDDELMEMYVDINAKFNMLIHRFEHKQHVKIGMFQKMALSNLILGTRDVVPRSVLAEWDMLEQILE